MQDIPEWTSSGLCGQTDPDKFFPDDGVNQGGTKKICDACEVSGDCLEYALTHDERFGIWGGKSVEDRKEIKKSRKQVTP